MGCIECEELLCGLWVVVVVVLDFVFQVFVVVEQDVVVFFVGYQYEYGFGFGEVGQVVEVVVVVIWIIGILIVYYFGCGWDDGYVVFGLLQVGQEVCVVGGEGGGVEVYGWVFCGGRFSVFSCLMVLMLC